MNRHIAIRKEKGQAVHNLIAWLFVIPLSDRVRKVIAISDFENFHKGKSNPILRKAGFVTKAEHYVIPKSSRELIEDLRLDYLDTKFSESEGFVVIEYVNNSKSLDHTFNTYAINEKLLYTNTGMTGVKQNIIPEYYFPDKVEFAGDDIFTVYNKDGNVIKI